jgi:hypothetical protein
VWQSVPVFTGRHTARTGWDGMPRRWLSNLTGSEAALGPF